MNVVVSNLDRLIVLEDPFVGGGRTMFEGEKTLVFWVGLILLGLASVGLFAILWSYIVYPSEYYLRSSVPVIVGGIVFILIGLYMMKSGAEREATPV